MGQSPDISEMYRPPGVDVNVVPEPSAPKAVPEFYVVAPAKFIVLFVCTLGIYQFYWFYAHFRRSKHALRDDSWPWARTIFAVLFTHSLFRRISSFGGTYGTESRFNADNHATVYVILSIAGHVADRVAQHSETFGGLDLLGIGLTMATLFPLYAAQKAANLACSDPDGTQNSRLTFGNWVWCGLGMLLWLLILVGMLLPE